MRQLASFSRLVGVRKGQTIFAEGERSSEARFLVSGCVKLTKAAPARNVIVRIVGPGGPLGLVAAFESCPYPATAVALTDSTLVQIPERDFLAVLDRHPEFVRQLLGMVLARQAELTRRIVEMTGSVESRLARILFDLLDSPGFPEGPGHHIPLVLSRQDLADLAGTTIETTIRVMSRWAKEEVVLTRPDGFRIPDPEVLRRISNGE